MVNNSLENLKIRGVINSCGCTSTDISNDTLYHHSSVKVRIGYNPVNRPGIFFKQVTVVLEGLILDSLVVEAYVKGTVLSKNEVSYNPLNYESARIKIKPVIITDNSKNDNSLLNDFINDITFVIDKDGFANLRLEYFQHSKNNKEREAKITEIKKLIVAALSKRGYQSFQVGFSDSPLENIKDSIPKNFFVFLRSVGYYRNNIKETSVIFKGLKNVSHDHNIADSISIRYALDISNPQQKVNWNEGNPNNFVKQIVRTVLMKKGATIGIYVKGLFKSGEESFIKKTLNAQIKNLHAELQNQGIEIDKVAILPPIFLKGDKYEMSYKIIELNNSEKIIEWTKFQHMLDSIRKVHDEKLNLTNAYKNNIPVYYQRIEFQNEFDTTNSHFKEWFNLFKSVYSTNKNIKIIIEATASNAPTTKAYDNAFVARRRAATAKNNLKEFASKNGIQLNDKLFLEPYALVKGPLFNEQDFLIQDYKKYQYVKIILVEIDSSIRLDSNPIPYQINFENNEFNIPTSGLLFQKFINSLIPEINRNGFVEIIMESSTSKVPTTNYNSNRVLAFERMQNTKSEILKAVAEKGYNPLRLIFKEERILIQGPEFKIGTNSKDPMFKEFQYIKIIPRSY